MTPRLQFHVQLLCACLLLAARAWAAGPIQHVVHISLDGLGGIHLENYLKHAPHNFPTFARLTREGAYTFNARCDFHVSETVPNHISMLTGRPVLHGGTGPGSHAHGYTNNAPLITDIIHTAGNTNIPYKASVFDVVHDHGFRTAFYASKTRLALCIASYDHIHGAPDITGVDNGRRKIDRAGLADLYDVLITNVVNAALMDLRSVSAAPHYLFLHVSEPDLTAHTYGWSSETASNMVRFVDRELARVFAAIEENSILKDRTALVITSDHGGGGGGFPLSHVLPQHPLNYTVPIFLWGPGIPAGTNAYSLFRNRTDPGPGRPDYTARSQPLRNSDTANIALHLLGLPPIPGSTIRPTMGTNVAVNIQRASDTECVISWPADATAYVLESTDSLATAHWQVETQSLISATGNIESLISAGAAARFFRLRREEPSF